MKTRIEPITAMLALLLGFAGIVFAAPTSLTQSVTHDGETITLQLNLESLRGPNFELWSQDATGAYVSETVVDERSYIGTVVEYPGAISCGVLQDDGDFRGAVYFDRGVTWFTLDTAVVETRALNYDNFTAYQVPGSSSVTPGQAGSTTYGFELGIDADYDYFNTTSGGSLAKAFESIEYSVCAMRAIYMRDVLLKPHLGRVIVRTDLANDPYTGLTQGDYLSAVRVEWNDNQTSTDPDLVAGVSPAKIGGGLAWVGVVGTTSGYSVNQCNSSGNFDVVMRHEVGHNWDLGHFVGGSPEGAGLMGGNQPGRFSSTEAYRVFNHRDAKISAGGILDDEGTYTTVELPPYASLDSISFTQTVDASVTVDVVANDHDANGQAVSLTSFESTSAHGGTITQQGQDLVYTAQGAYLGTDYFHYTITDTTGKPATGVVIVNVQPDDDLALYLPLDDTTGTAAANLSVFGSDSALNGTDFDTASAAGKYGNAAVLDGVDDHLVASGVNMTSDTVTMAAWIKPNGVQPAWAGIIFDRSGGAAGLNIGSGPELRYHWNNGNYGWNSGLVPPDDTWTFVALVVEPTQATIYMNDGTGFVSATNTTAHAPAGFSTTYVGRDPNNSARSFAGAVDEVRLYSKAMTQADLQSIYDGGAAESPDPFDGSIGVDQPDVSWASAGGATSYEVYLGSNQAAVASATTASPEYVGSTTTPDQVLDLQPNTTYYWRVDSVTSSTTVAGPVWTFTTGVTVHEYALVGHWKLDDANGTSAADSSGSSHTGTLTNGPTWGTGLDGAAVTFDGVDDSVNFGTGPSLSGKTDFTLSAWIKTSASSDQVIVQQRNGGFNGQYQFRVTSSGALSFYIYGNSGYQFTLNTTATVNDGQWHHVVAVRDGDDGYIYVDGSPTPAASGNGTARDLSASIGVALGRDIRDNNKPFNGDMDEVKIYSIAKSGAEVQQAYNDFLAGLNSDPVANDATFSVNENSAANTGVGTVVATDPDVGDLLTYAITSGNTGGAFSIDSGSGDITVAGPLNHEVLGQYVLTVEVTDDSSSQGSDTATITVNVNDVDESGDTGVAAWEESVHQGTAFALIRTTTLAGDFTATVDLSSISGDATYEFVIDAEDLGQAVVHLLDGNGWSLRLEQWSNTGQLGVTRYGVSDYLMTAEAGQSLASPYGDVHHVTYVVDSVNSVTRVYVDAVLVGSLNQVPSMNGSAMTLGDLGMRNDSDPGVTAFAAYDSALDASEVLAHSSAWFGPNGSPVANGETFLVDEDVNVGGVVGVVSASDPDAGDTLSYAITSGNASGAFAIDANGQITTASGLDHETTAQYVVTVEVSDDGYPSLSDTATITVDVGDVNESPVANDGLLVIDEDVSIGTSVGSVAVSDPDSGDSLSYAITAGNTGGAFSIDGGGGITTSAALDHETIDQYVLTVTVTDSGLLADTATMTVDVGDVNEAPTANDGVLAINENVSGGAAVGSVSASDPDAGDGLGYAITGGNTGGAFAIDSGGGITTTTALDHESIDQYVLTVTVTDGGLLTDAATLVVNVGDVNESPVANDNILAIDEDASNGTLVGAVSASDPDDGDLLGFAITGGNTGNAFAIDGSGNITAAAVLDHEASSTYALTVTVTDGGLLTDTAMIAVTVNDVNEAPTANDGALAVDENSSNGTSVGSVSASDPDDGDSLSYAITGGNTGGAFAIGSNGVITVAGGLDYETLDSYVLTVTVTDGGLLTDTATVSVSINDLVEVTAPVIATGASSNVDIETVDVAYTVTDSGDEDPTVTVFYGTSDGGTTAGAWTGSASLGTQGVGAGSTALSGLDAGTQYYYTFRAVNSAGEDWGSSGSFTTLPDDSPKLVRTTVSSVSSSTWTTVNLGQAYTSPVIIATPIYPTTSNPPVVTRITNITTSGFDLKLDRADGLSTAMTLDVSLVVVEEGVYTVAEHGVNMEAVTYTSTVTGENNNWAVESRSFQNSYTSPVVVGQVMSANDSNWSTFWSQGSSRQSPVDASNLNVGKHVGEDPNATRADETIGYIVIESGTGTLDGVAYEAGLGADSVRGFGNSSNPYTYALSGGLSTASAAAASISGMDGGNGAWAVLSGATPITPTSLGLHALEDQMNDSELKHTTTQAAYLVFE